MRTSDSAGRRSSRPTRKERSAGCSDRRRSPTTSARSSATSWSARCSPAKSCSKPPAPSPASSCAGSHSTATSMTRPHRTPASVRARPRATSRSADRLGMMLHDLAANAPDINPDQVAEQDWVEDYLAITDVEPGQDLVRGRSRPDHRAAQSQQPRPPRLVDAHHRSPPQRRLAPPRSRLRLPLSVPAAAGAAAALVDIKHALAHDPSRHASARVYPPSRSYRDFSFHCSPGRGVGQPGEGSAEVLRGLGCGVGVLAQLRGVGLQVSHVAA